MKTQLTYLHPQIKFHFPFFICLLVFQLSFSSLFGQEDTPNLYIPDIYLDALNQYKEVDLKEQVICQGCNLDNYNFSFNILENNDIYVSLDSLSIAFITSDFTDTTTSVIEFVLKENEQIVDRDTVLVYKSLPDLEILNFQISDTTFAAEDSISLSFDIINDGNSYTNISGKIGIFLSRDPNYDTSDIILSNVQLPIFSPYDTVKFSTNFSIPGGISLQYPYLLLVADMDSLIYESNKTNNVLVREVDFIPQINFRKSVIVQEDDGELRFREPNDFSQSSVAYNGYSVGKISWWNDNYIWKYSSGSLLPVWVNYQFTIDNFENLDSVKVSYLAHGTTSSGVYYSYLYLKVNDSILSSYTFQLIDNSEWGTYSLKLSKEYFKEGINQVKVGTSASAQTYVALRGIAVDLYYKLNNNTIDDIPPTANITYSDTDGKVNPGDIITINVAFSEPMAGSPIPQIEFSGAMAQEAAYLSKVNETRYTYVLTIPNATGIVNVALSNGQDLAGNDLVATPASGNTFVINPLYGDVDVNGTVQYFDATLILQYSVGLDPLPTVDPLPWEPWRIVIADIDMLPKITANDASLILQYAEGLINSIPNSKIDDAYVSVTVEEGFLIFRSTGNLFSLNVFAFEHTQYLGTPEILDANMVSVTNITPTSYAIGAATAIAPSNGDIFMKIPYTADQNPTLTFDLIVNTIIEQITIDLITGIIEISDADIYFYPNPAYTTLFINGWTSISKISFYDLSGKFLFNYQIAYDQIDISSLHNGIYIMKIETEKGVITKKLLKQ